MQRVIAPQAHSRAEVEEIRKRAECLPTGESTRPREADGRLRLSARVAGNGLNFPVITPGPDAGRDRDDESKP